jgi:hypothetical protein
MIANRLATRRSLLAVAGAAALSACGRGTTRTGDAALVSITRISGYGQALFDEVRRIVIKHRVGVKGKRILPKPNLVEFNVDAPINIHPLVVHAALEAFRSLEARTFGSGKDRAIAGDPSIWRMPPVT